MRLIILILVFLIVSLQNGVILLLVNSSQSIWKIGTEIYLSVNSNEDKLSLFEFRLVEFEKIKIDDYEFIYEGKIYDIKKQTIIGINIKISAKLDNVELVMMNCGDILKSILLNNLSFEFKDFFSKKKFDWKFIVTEIEVASRKIINSKKIYNILKFKYQIVIPKIYAPPKYFYFKIN